MVTAGQIRLKPNPRHHGDDIPVYFGSSQDSRITYDAANDEWTVQTKDAGGTFRDRFRIEANTNTPDADLVDVPLKWTAGRAVTAGDYSAGRDADGTNQLHFNVPTGAGFEWSVNDVGVIFLNSTSLGIGIAPVSGTRVTLPQEDDAATPTFAFGDGDTGLYESADDTLRVATAGVTRWQWTGNYLQSNSSGGGWMYNANSSGTSPTIGPHASDQDTGIGRTAVDQLALIAGGVEGIRVTEASSAITAQVFGELIVDGNLNHDGSNVGLYGVAPAGQASKISDPSGGATVDSEARTAINSIIDALEGIGISASA